jgi:hypothetical protein
MPSVTVCDGIASRKMDNKCATMARLRRRDIQLLADYSRHQVLDLSMSRNGCLAIVDGIDHDSVAITFPQNHTMMGCQMLEEISPFHVVTLVCGVMSSW